MIVIIINSVLPASYPVWLMPAVPLNEVMPAPVVETIPPAIADDTAITERYDFNAMVQLSVWVADRKQAHIAIDGFYLNALMTMTGML